MTTPSAAGPTTKLVKDAKIRRVVLCSGKVYFDLLEEREKRGVDDVYLMRVEQLYPFPLKSLAQELARFKNAEVVWCQEEPKNMGAWTFVEPYLEWVLGHAGSKAKRAALCRPPGLGRDRDRPDDEAPRPARGLPGRGLRGLTSETSTPERQTKTLSRGLTWRPKSAYPPSANPSPRRRSASGSRSRARR